MSDPKEDPELGTCEKLAAKIAKVMDGIGEIPKNGHNDRFNYSYPLDEDVMQALREQMTEHGLVALPSVAGRSIQKETTSGGTEMLHTRVQFEITLIDTDSGQQKTVHWEGEAQDAQDKGLYKAYTSGMKYWALKTFLMSAGDDVERADAESGQPRQSSQNGGGGRRDPTDKQVSFAEDLSESSVWTDSEQKALDAKIQDASRSELSDLIDDMQDTISERKAEKNGESEQSEEPPKEPDGGDEDPFAPDDELPF